MTEAQVWAVISILGAAVLLLVVERFVAKLSKVWMVRALARAVRPLIKLLADATPASTSETAHSRGHREVPRTSWGSHGRGCRCGVIQA